MSKVKVRLYQPVDYQFVADWWKAHGSEALPADVLPPTGVIVTRDGQPIAASFCYLSNARAAYVDFTVAKPGLPAILSLRAAQRAVEGAVAIAREAKCLMVWTLTAHRAIQRIYADMGFKPTSPQQHYYLLLDQSVSPDMLTN